MTSRIFRTTTLAIFATVLTARAGVPAAPAPKPGAAGPPPVAAVNRFAFTYDAAVRAGDSSEPNTFASPLSLISALAVAGEGSGGETRREFDKVLGLPKGPDFRAFPSLLAPTKKNPGTIFEYASTLFVDKSRVTLKPEYVRSVRGGFNTALAEVSFADAKGAAAGINGWIGQKTHGMIRDVLQPADLAGPPPVPLVIVNAVYFKAPWAHEFYEGATEPAVFMTASGQSVKVPMMAGKKWQPYSEDKNFLYTEIPYANHEYALALVLPSTPGDKTPLTFERFEKLRASAKPVDVEIYLPRFKLKRRVEVRSVLEKLGLTSAFSDAADFSAMGVAAGGPLRLNRVIHQAVLAVDEKGS